MHRDYHLLIILSWQGAELGLVQCLLNVRSTNRINLKTAVGSDGEQQRVVSVALCAAMHLTKMVKSSMFATHFGLEQLAVLTAFQLPF